MSILTTTLISDVKEEFEGGHSLAVDWDSILRRAMIHKAMKKARLHTLKRTVNIYGGLAQDLALYYCPTGVHVPIALTPNNGSRKFNYVPPAVFHSNSDENKFTIEYINGVRFLRVRRAGNESILTVDTMDAVGTIAGDVAVALNEHDFMTGSAAIQAVFTEAGDEIGDTFDTAQDITSYLKGIALIPAKIAATKDITSIEFRLKTDDSNYYSVISTSDSVGDYLVDGWNQIRFNLANATQTGSPTSTNITEWSIVVTTNAGTTQTIILDKITIQKTAPYVFEFYSSQPFIDATTKAWKNTVSFTSSDLVRIDDDIEPIIHYEMCELVLQSSTFESVNNNVSQRFRASLNEAYKEYYSLHPSDEKPMSYSKSPNIDVGDQYGGVGLQDDTVSDT